jgi:DNA repair exonuclease SbcCD ATPase subunit
MGLWDEIKDAFKTKSERDEERTEDLKNALEQERGLTEQLEELEKQYQEYLNSQKEEIDLDAIFPPTLGLEKIEFTPESDQSIQNRANEEIIADKTKDVIETENKYGEKIDGVQDELDSADANRINKQEEIDELYAELQRRQKNDSIKRGMARGSVLTSLSKDLESEEQASINQVEKEFFEKAQKLNEELEALSSEQEKALNELDLHYAAELSEKIAKLKEERDALSAKYTKFNNSVDEKEAKYQIERQKDIDKYLDDKRKEEAKLKEEQRAYEEKYGYSGEKLKNYSERYKLAFDFYMSLSADIAVDALKASPNMKFYLGNYYDKLMDELKKREYDGNKIKKYYA